MKFNEYLFWLDSNQSLAYSLIRIFLGAALMIRGWVFFADPDAVTQLAQEDGLYIWFTYVTLAHLIGGFFVMVGMQTRLAALVQVPILGGAVFIVHSSQSLGATSQSLELAAMVLVLLVVYTFFGSGSLSVDHYMSTNRTSKIAEEDDSGLLS